MSGHTPPVDTTRASGDTPTCGAPDCGIELVLAPDHPAAVLGTWYEHPRYDRWPLIGHTVAVLVPDDEPSPPKDLA